MSSSAEILLVEDNPADAELTLHTFAKYKLSNLIALARDGEEALNFFFANGGLAETMASLKLILLDLKLPKVNGLEVLQRIKNDPRTRHIPVVILTSSREDRDLAEAYRLGANSYIVKPVVFTDFTEVIRQLGLYWLILNYPLERG